MSQLLQQPEAARDNTPYEQPARGPMPERVMEDGYVSPEERPPLLTHAGEWDLNDRDLEVVHREFPDTVLDTAMEDRRISKQKREDLTRAATWLGVEAGDSICSLPGAGTGEGQDR